MSEFDEPATPIEPAEPLPAEPVAQEPDEVTAHNGDPLPPDRDFCVPAPDTIGPVVTAWSTLREHQQPRSPAVQSLVATLVLTLMAGVFAGAVYLMGEQDQEMLTLGAVIGAALGVPLAILVWWKMGFRHKLSFVGQYGFAQIKLRGSRENVGEADVFSFGDAIDLFTSETRQYVNGVYAGTSYEFRWENNEGQRVRRLKGSYSSRKGTPKVGSPYWFAKSAEVAWSRFLLEAIQQELEDQGSVHFTVNKKDWVRVGPGFMEFCFKGKEPTRVDVEEIDQLQIGDGNFLIKTKDAKRFGSQGKFGFAYGKMANARVFLLCLENLCGYQFGGG